jgi:hypothetical protein
MNIRASTKRNSQTITFRFHRKLEEVSQEKMAVGELKIDREAQIRNLQ